MNEREEIEESTTLNNKERSERGGDLITLHRLMTQIVYNANLLLKW